jgi:hypothetical protein
VNEEDGYDTGVVYKIRPRLETPTYIAVQNSRGVSAALGWVVIILLILAIIMLLVLTISVLSSNLPQIVKSAVIALCVVAIYGCVVSIAVVDGFSALDMHLKKTNVYLKRVESQLYNLKVVVENQIRKEEAKKRKTNS